MEASNGHGRPRALAIAFATLASALFLCATATRGRPAAGDGRPNILVVMTDDMATDRREADAERAPAARRRKGTTFADAVDSFPLCCPARATFITGQYAHNHGVVGNFYPYGWYGMKDRGNTLPAWLAATPATGPR